MADVRALLRQQRAARRIQHPLASYTDAGKLLCTLCREYVRTESLWDKHIRSSSHEQRSSSHEQREPRLQKGLDEGGMALQSRSQGQDQEQDGGQAGHTGRLKRKLDDQEADDGEMLDSDMRKRSKSGFLEHRLHIKTKETASGASSSADDAPAAGKERADGPARTREGAPTPPSLLRRASNTPSQGVELQIPSRPATPSRASSSATPSHSHTPTRSVSQQQSRQPSSSGLASERPPASAPLAQVDEAEWAAFEAEMAAAEKKPRPAMGDATVISAPPMTAEQSAALKQKAAEPKDTAQAKVDIEDEREEARRALENEFDEMLDLEERVQRLRERRESLRRSALDKTRDAATTNGKTTEVDGHDDDNHDDEEDEDEDEDEEDDWAGLRFRVG
ncbi:hypothetical protein CDD82_272 [Ophiocordyceps australis]|uniref:Coiled-coil domain-containing protein 16 n=1 Tax=Ophiocordyceps australis TaxID=1399860 RepID=A0A2C5YME4_9HYPO|nr:hypothetical protein CDD82_272 [Ophiocordyceps australis]